MSIAWRNRLILASPLLAIALLAVVEPTDDGPTFCPFALCTGTACPGCGMTRAAGHLFRGDIAAAMTYHPLVPMILAQLSVAWGWFALASFGWVQKPNNRVLTIVLAASAVALIVVWVARMATGTLPPV